VKSILGELPITEKQAKKLEVKPRKLFWLVLGKFSVF
jgi:hypothetical protein